MHLHFERTVKAKSDCSILSLTWMGKVPDELPEDEGWKLNRTNYYQEGWLATGNVRGIVGVTFTTSHCKKNVEFPLRTNYNLRGHRSEVILVKWNEPYQKLASCDSSGIIFVWIKYEGRWSIELINDRNTPVTHFSWSHDGRMALICYQDGFVLVGSVAGQRYWSSMLNLEATITCGIWTPDDQQVYFGTTSGQIIVMDVHGAMVSQVQLSLEVGITCMAWSCEKFKMEEGDENEAGVANASERKFVLAVSLQDGLIYLLKTFDDILPIQIETGLQGPLCMEWSNSRELLAVAGMPKERKSTITQPTEYINFLKFYNEKGILLHSVNIPYSHAPVSALTWGHNDKRLFLATGTQIHIAWVSRRIATLQLLSRLQIHDSIRNESQLSVLPLPARIRNLIGNLFAQTIRCCVPELTALREFVSRPPVGSVRLHCTMIRHDEDNNLSSGTCYTLYLEYLGGLVPLLKGKRTSKIRPEFVIFDPQAEENNWSTKFRSSGLSPPHTSNVNGIVSDSSESDHEEGCTSSPRMQRRRKKRNKSTSRLSANDKVIGHTILPIVDNEPEDLSYVDTLPEHARLVEVTSNIWGTKFKIHGVANSVPSNLGQVTYKTSLLHLQPRQMTLVITELRDDFPVIPDPSFNPNIFSEDEEDATGQNGCKSKITRVSIDPPIAPMSPRGNRLTKVPQLYLPTTETNKTKSTLITKVEVDIENYCEDATSYNNCDSIRPSTLLTTRINNNNNNNNNSSQNSTSFVGQFNRNTTITTSITTTTTIMTTTNNSSTNQRHAISPLYCEGSIPSLQSPKNAVAPSDIIFDRPPAQTLITYSNDYTSNANNIHQVKSNLINDPNRNGLTFNLNSESSNMLLIKRNDEIYLNKNRKNIIEITKTKCSTITTSTENNTKDLKFIDDEQNIDAIPGPSKPLEQQQQQQQQQKQQYLVDSMVRSCSVGYLDMVDAQLVPSDVALLILRKDTSKRLILVNRKPKAKRQSRQINRQDSNSNQRSKSPKLKNCGKSKSLDSSDLFPNTEVCSIPNLANCLEEVTIENNQTSKSLNLSLINDNNNKIREDILINTKKEKLGFFSSKSPLARRKKSEEIKHSRKTLNQHIDHVNRNGIHTQALVNLEKLITKLREDDKSTPPSSPRLPRSSPSSPAPSKKGKRPQSSSPIRKNFLSSPLLGRKNKKNKYQESSDDEVAVSGDEICNGTNYKDLETFQKAQLRQKLKRGKIEPNGSSCGNYIIPQRREFVMHNKAPMWNENSQVYQLDFGGRVTQESAKNFQIEFRGKQVMQFGRIDGNAYTLDFQYPFSALQAFAVALANVTQRLK